MKRKLEIIQGIVHSAGWCIEPGCQKNHAPGRNYCYKHVMANYRKNKPMQYAYNVYKQNQKKANRVALTFTEFSKQK